MWGDAAYVQRQQERQAREARIDKEQWDQGTELENLLRDAETDREAAKLVALARLLGPDDFARREDGLAWVARERVGRRGNDPVYQKAMRVHERIARLSIQVPVMKARAVLALVESWEVR